MDSVKKHLKKELLRTKKNPGRKNRQARKEANKIRRGQASPGTRITETKKTKAQKRSSLKIELRKAMQDN